MDKQKVIHDLADEILKKLGVDYKLSVKEEEGVYLLQIDSVEHAPILIGRYGETLQSLQRILESILYNDFDERVQIVININDYREKQKERLENIAQNVAERVKTEGQEQILNSFSGFERRIIHEYISQNYPDLTSYSEGEGAQRQLHVGVKGE